MVANVEPQEIVLHILSLAKENHELDVFFPLKESLGQVVTI